MTSKDKLIRVYTGTEIQVNILKEELNKVGISCAIQNDFNSAINAGFSGGTPSALDLYIHKNDIEEAGPIVKDFIEINKE